MSKTDLLQEIYDSFNIFPCNSDKSPACKSWTAYREKKMPFKELKKSDFYGLVTGVNDIEVIDIDNHFGDAEDIFSIVMDNISEELHKKLLIVKTGGGGYHLYYRCNKIESNQKLASRINEKGRPETLIETRGKGGYVVCPPSAGYEFLNKKIKAEQITTDQRDELMEICRALNEVVDDKPRKNVTATTDNSEAPGALYLNDSNSVLETIQLLKKHGWKSNDNKHWTRPGKKKGISATFNKVGKNKFYVFSTNAYPFDSSDMSGTYTMFGVLAELEYNGNYTECAKALAKKYKTNNTEAPAKPEKKKKKETAGTKKWKALLQIIDEWGLHFRFNELTKIVEYKKGKDWEQLGLLINDIVREMETQKGITSISSAKVFEMISTTTISTPYNPVRDFIRNIPKWDGKDHFSALTNYIKLQQDENSDFVVGMLKKHFARTVRCAMEKDYINRIVLVFHGPQEIGKTKFWEWVCPGELFYSESADPADKDSVLALARYLIYNFDELDQLQKKDVARLKSFISKGSIVKRVSYGRTDERFDRIVSFVGSTNKSDILADESNTRWMILKVKGFDWRAYTKKIDRNQLWAQAKAMYMADVDWCELSDEERSERERRNNADFLETSQERELLMKYFDEGDQKFTATEIKIELEQKFNTVKINMTQLVRELHRLYGQPITEYINGKKGRYYSVMCNLDTFEKEKVFDNFYENEKPPF